MRGLIIRLAYIETFVLYLIQLSIQHKVIFSFVTY